MTTVQNKKLDQIHWSLGAVNEMSEAEFVQWASLFEARTGISLPEKRRSFLITNLNIRLRELGFESYQEYYRYLMDGRRGVIEWEVLVDRLTIHETRFFRDESALAMIKEVFIPQLSSTALPERIDIWSVGCATGEEPYGLAMLIDHALVSHDLVFYVGVTASDISMASLSTARKGIYHINRLKNLPSVFLEKYFIQTDAEHYQVVASVRERTCFIQTNLFDLTSTRIGLMDIIFCQNVLIYFKRKQRIAILNQLVEHLKPGGLLVLGAGEINSWVHPLIEPVPFGGTLAYRCIEDPSGCEV